jgi:hypothetical protein
MEIWKDVFNYQGIYQVSNLGNIKSLNYKKTKKEKVLISSVGSNGYLTVKLCKNGIAKTRTIHQLVLESFLNYMPDGTQKLVVNHINFIRRDNRLENLEIVTMRDNGNQKHIKSSSKYTGVTWNKEKKKWRVILKMNMMLI